MAAKRNTKKKPAKMTAAQKRKVEREQREKTQEKFRRWGTISLSVMVPTFTLACTRFSGSLLVENVYWLAVIAGGLAITSLVVSLSHLTEAIELITGSTKRSSRALAIAFDGGVVLSELTHATSQNDSLRVVALSLLIVLTCLSIALNWYAFKFGQHGTDKVS